MMGGMEMANLSINVKTYSSHYEGTGACRVAGPCGGMGGEDSAKIAPKLKTTTH